MSAHLELAARLIKRHEGSVLRGGAHVAYDDATGRAIEPGSLVFGHPSLGYGRALDRKGLSEAEAEYLLANDLADAEAGAMLFAGPAWAGLSDVRKAALIDMAHQMGASGIIAFKQMRLAVQMADWDAAAAQALDSKWARLDSPDRAREIAAMLVSDQEIA